MSRRQLLLLLAGFFTLRLILVLSAADRLSEPDAAEVKLMAIGDAWVASGEPPTLDGLLHHARAGTNAPHGAYLLVSLLYAALVVPLGASESYLALKLVALFFATIGLGAWTSTAAHLGGRRAAAVVAGLLVLPPPGFLSVSLVAWGSHPESVALLGLCAWALTSTRIRSNGDAWAAGGMLGFTVGCNLLVAPAVAALAGGWTFDRWRESRESGGSAWASQAVAGAIGAALPLGLLLYVTGGLGASVVETAGSSPLELVQQARQGGEPLLGPTLAAMVPLTAWSTAVISDPGLRSTLDVVWTVALAAALVIGLLELRRHERWWGRAGALLFAAPAVHVLTVAMLAPRRPFVPPRYLLPLWPMLLLGLGLVVAWTWERKAIRPLTVAIAVGWLAAGLALQGTLIRPDRMDGFTAYRPVGWLAADIGHVTYTEAPWVNRFLEARGIDDAHGFGFATGAGASDDALADAPTDPLDPVALMDRRQRWLDAQKPTAAERARLHENIGWSLTVFAWGRTGVWHAVLSHLDGADREATGRGLGTGLRIRGAEGCAAADRISGPDRVAVIRGVAVLSANLEPTCRSLIEELPKPRSAPPDPPDEQTEETEETEETEPSE